MLIDHNRIRYVSGAITLLLSLSSLPVFAAGFVIPPIPFGVEALTEIPNAGILTVNSHDDIYVTDDGSPESDRDPGGIYRVTQSGAVTPVGSGFLHPEGVAVDAAGNIYVADTNHQLVKKIATNGLISEVGHGFTYPRAVAVAPNCTARCTVVVLDDNSSGGIRIKKISPDGRTSVFSTFLATFVTNVTADTAGNVYVPDTAHNAIARIRPDGSITRIFGRFYHPMGVAVDLKGNIYVNDMLNAAIKRVNIYGKVTTIVPNVGVSQGIALDRYGVVFFTGVFGTSMRSPGVFKLVWHRPWN